ncbi:hypothetical protein AURANDRAFT_34120 [Aureococcus anophagefferens]|uniref:AP2/ERF domain-containing protein n=1 Tax=Aureococcus anophagefferens TaxID=44056 RepID=F0YNE8_AURAN|nr:hypothetical protein AURANDRAFT_34120 [Aureococcus anophagefferens]EGB03361.1 hypothetical protein AURANDRAFT_34120 [Aureococcus anophagefferens]|eukprot:XP_009041934.1 hypothetical protein AURANDRAFT_34120 [Aureococcus anophagefferens]
MEQWKTIEEYPNYKISSFGNIKTKTQNRSMCFDKDGYLQVNLSKSGVRKTVRVHRLVALAFIENTDNKPFVDHIDRDRTNNNISNLRWATKSENQANQTKYSNNTSGFKGVSIDKRNGKYKAAITIQSKKKFLGYFKTAEETSAVYEEKAKELRGDFYCDTNVKK